MYIIESIQKEINYVFINYLPTNHTLKSTYHKDIFICLFNVHDTVSLFHKKMCLMF